MQDNCSSFEGWAITIKSKIFEINDVELDWETSQDLNENEKLHYNRFLYRVIKFANNYSWFKKNPSKTIEIEEFISTLKRKLVVNSESEPRKPNSDDYSKSNLKNYSENQLENKIVHELVDDFKKTDKLITLSRQFPVGVFLDKKAEKNAIFPHRKSAIDIWGVDDNNDIYLYELKNYSNTTVGAISEMLFYSYILIDIVNKKIEIPRGHNLEKHIHKNGVNCSLLAPSKHPLIDKKVFDIMNLNNSGIKYGFIEISEVNNKLKFERK